jgi:hypothetical protein
LETGSASILRCKVGPVIETHLSRYFPPFHLRMETDPVSETLHVCVCVCVRRRRRLFF